MRYRSQALLDQTTNFQNVDEGELCCCARAHSVHARWPGFGIASPTKVRVAHAVATADVFPTCFQSLQCLEQCKRSNARALQSCRHHARPVAFPPLLPLYHPVAHPRRMRSTSCSQPARRQKVCRTDIKLQIDCSHGRDRQRREERTDRQGRCTLDRCERPPGRPCCIASICTPGVCIISSLAAHIAAGA